jgi:hypothetical protein
MYRQILLATGQINPYQTIIYEKCFQQVGNESGLQYKQKGLKAQQLPPLSNFGFRTHQVSKKLFAHNKLSGLLQ